MFVAMACAMQIVSIYLCGRASSQAVCVSVALFKFNTFGLIFHTKSVRRRKIIMITLHGGAFESVYDVVNFVFGLIGLRQNEMLFYAISLINY